MNYFHILLQTPRTCKLFNSVAVARNGDLYFSESTSEYAINRVMHSTLLNPSGRVIHYSRSTGKMKVLLDKIWFANGVALSPTENFVIVAETFSSRLIKVWLSGPKKGNSEIFFDGLPGGPDNLIFDKDGIWVTLADASDENHPGIHQTFAKYPTIRRF